MTEDSKNVIPINRAALTAMTRLLEHLAKAPEPTCPYNVLLIDRSGLMKMMTMPGGRPRPEIFLPVTRRRVSLLVSSTADDFQPPETRVFSFCRKVGDVLEYREDY